MGYYQINPEDSINELELLKSIFKAARNRGTSNTGIFGLRMQQHSFNFFLQKLRVLCAGSSTDTDVDQIQEVFGNTLFIHLTRQNKLDQAISLVKATQTGLWHKAPDGTELERLFAQQEPSYDAQAIAKHLAELTEMDANWVSWFREQEKEPVIISYEDLSASPAKVLAKLLGDIGVDSVDANGINLPVAKLADKTNEVWATRFLVNQRY